MFSASALSLINVPTFSVFRNSSSMLVAALEYMLLQKRMSRPQWLFLLLVMAASLIYGWNDLQFSFWGYVYAILHVLCIALYSVGVKKLNVEFSSSLEMSIYNNTGSMPILFIVAMYEYQSSSSVISIQNKACAVASVPSPNFTNNILVPKHFTLQVPASFLISWSGLILQRLFSATSWMALNNFNKLPVLLFSYAIFRDAYSWGQAVGLAVSVAASMGYSYCSLPPSSLFEAMHRSPRSHLANVIYSCRKLFFVAVVSIALCVSGFAMSSHHLNVFQRAHSSASHRIDLPEHSISSCFRLASMCYGSWTKETADASFVRNNRNVANVVWLIDSEASALSPSRDKGRTVIESVLVQMRQVLSRSPSLHVFLGIDASGFASDSTQLTILFDDFGIENHEISVMTVHPRDALARMLVADVVVGYVGSLVDVVGQFSAHPFVIQVLSQHEDSESSLLQDVSVETRQNANASLYFFIGSWIDASAIPAGKSSVEISDKLSAHLASSDRSIFVPSTYSGNCDEKRVLEACRKHFPAGQKRDSCFWGVRSRRSDLPIQLAELFSFIKSSLRDSLKFVYEPFHPETQDTEHGSAHSWVDNFLGISRLMQVLKVTTVRPDGQPESRDHRCNNLVRQSYSESALGAKRNPQGYAEHMCPSCVFKGARPVNVASLPSELASGTRFSGHQLRGTAATRTKLLSCDGLNPKPRSTSKLVPGWPQTRLSESVTPSESVCYHQRSFRRCHDVHANLGDSVSVRACQWRLPDGPCEVIDRDHREQLVAVTKGHAFLDTHPLVQLAWRTQVFGATPSFSALFGEPASFSGPKFCTRADEIIACEEVDGIKGQSFWDKVRGASNAMTAHGSIWHLRDSPGEVHA